MWSLVVLAGPTCNSVKPRSLNTTKCKRKLRSRSNSSSNNSDIDWFGVLALDTVLYLTTLYLKCKSAQTIYSGRGITDGVSIVVFEATVGFRPDHGR